MTMAMGSRRPSAKAEGGPRSPSSKAEDSDVEAPGGCTDGRNQIKFSEPIFGSPPTEERDKNTSWRDRVVLSSANPAGSVAGTSRFPPYVSERRRGFLKNKMVFVAILAALALATLLSCVMDGAKMAGNGSLVSEAEARRGLMGVADGARPDDASGGERGPPQPQPPQRQPQPQHGAVDWSKVPTHALRGYYSETVVGADDRFRGGMNQELVGERVLKTEGRTQEPQDQAQEEKQLEEILERIDGEGGVPSLEEQAQAKLERVEIETNRQAPVEEQAREERQAQIEREQQARLKHQAQTVLRAQAEQEQQAPREQRAQMEQQAQLEPQAQIEQQAHEATPVGYVTDGAAGDGSTRMLIDRVDARTSAAGIMDGTRPSTNRDARAMREIRQPERPQRQGFRGFFSRMIAEADEEFYQKLAEERARAADRGAERGQGASDADERRAPEDDALRRQAGVVRENETDRDATLLQLAAAVRAKEEKLEGIIDRIDRNGGPTSEEARLFGEARSELERARRERRECIQERKRAGAIESR